MNKAFYGSRLKMVLEGSLMKNQRKFVKKLLRWFAENNRYFPWRDPSLSPYEVLIAEVMLQKTSSYKVAKIFPTFIMKFPSPTALSNARDEEIRQIVHPLGLQNIRARELKEIGEQLVKKHDGVVPERRADLIQLRGVGAYTANATLCFAFGKKLPIVDVNVSRVIGRVFYGEVDEKRFEKEESWNIISKMIPRGKCRQFNWAILDFSSLVCSHTRPKFEKCPMTDFCKFYSTAKTKGNVIS